MHIALFIYIYPQEIPNYCLVNNTPKGLVITNLLAWCFHGLVAYLGSEEQLDEEQVGAKETQVS